jgi:TetR/AcrR family transcriptional regulator, acrAB operon repressor
MFVYRILLFMARRTKEDAAVTREQLLDAAEREFCERGVARTSLAEIAAAAGVTRGAVYWHFRDKSDLFSAMCERATLPLESMLERAGGAVQEDPLGTLRSLAVFALTRLSTDPRSRIVFEVLFHKCEMAAELAPIAERRQRERRVCLDQVESLLRQAVVAGQLPADTDTQLTTQALHAFMTGVMHEWVRDVSAYDLATVAPHLVDMMFAGLRAQPPRRMARQCSPTSITEPTRSGEPS